MLNDFTKPAIACAVCEFVTVGTAGVDDEGRPCTSVFAQKTAQKFTSLTQGGSSEKS
jgi:hypothetical protein